MGQDYVFEKHSLEFKQLCDNVQVLPLYCTNALQNKEASIHPIFGDNEEEEQQMNTHFDEKGCTVESIDAILHNDVSQCNTGDQLEQPLRHSEL